MSELNNILSFIKETENLKNVTRTAWTSEGKQESVAEHSWRLAVLALSLAEYFPGTDLGKLLGMCLVHDFGEIYDGDISAKFENNPKEKLDREGSAINKVTRMLPERQKQTVLALWKEYNGAETEEARLVKALDKMETIIQHNQGKNPSDFDYEFNLQYGEEYARFNEIVRALRKLIDKDTQEKCSNGNRSI